MKRKLATLVITIAFCFSTLAFVDVAKLGCLVLDDKSGQPLQGIGVTGVFHMDNGWLGVKGNDNNVDESVTDANGFCQLRGRTNCGDACCFVSSCKDNYYWARNGGGGCYFSHRNIFGIWQPDNLVVTIRLQRVEHPIPLFVKSIRDKSGKKDLFTQGNGTIRLDLLEGDWLPPVGHGKIADVEFRRLSRQSFGEGVNGAGVKGESFRDSVAVKFLGADNGLVELHPSPKQCLKIRSAPENGYKPDYLCWKGADRKLEEVKSRDDDRSFCFRIRTRRDGHGRVVDAYYGKIYHDIDFAYGFQPSLHIASMRMFYYLNPNSLDRNLEWDRRTNLCANPGDVGDYPNDRAP